VPWVEAGRTIAAAGARRTEGRREGDVDVDNVQMPSAL